MIEAVMYGLTPIITIERFENPPPENILKRFKKLLPEKNVASLFASTPGIGIAARRRNTTSATSVNKILFRRVLS